MRNTIRKIAQFVTETQMIVAGDLLVAGLSGGADSNCLFYVLLELQKRIDFQFVGVHVHHNLRAEEADGDQHHVEEICAAHEVPLYVISKPVRAVAAERKMSIEEAGRAVRYEAFEQVRAAVGGTKIALAHHQDDLAETMIHHLVRGTGIAGLCSLKPVSGNRIRPLLCLTRAEIEAYLSARSLSWRTDSSNLDDAYTRNGIRHHIIPYLRDEVNAQALSHIAEIAKELQEIEELLGGLTEQFTKQFVDQRAEESLFGEDLRQQAAYIQRRLFLEEMKRLAGARRDFGRVHGEDVLALWNRQVGKKICLPYQLEAVRDYHGIRLRRQITNPSEKTADSKYKTKTQDAELFGSALTLQVPGETDIGGLLISTTIIDGKIERIIEKMYTKWLDYDKIKNSLVIRHRKPGDLIRVHPSGGSKKLKDYLIDRKIPQEHRDKLWLLADGSEILWIIGDRISEKYKVSDTTGKIICISIKGGTIHE